MKRNALHRQSSWQRFAAAVLCVAMPAMAMAQDWSREPDAASLIVVAIDEQPDPGIAAGSTPRGYEELADYDGSDRSIRAADTLRRDFALTEVAAWSIEALQLRCMVYRPAGVGDRDDLLQRLRGDPRVRIAQPLQEFHVLARPGAAGSTTAMVDAAGYNDPYHRLQKNFAAIQAEAAQRYSQGRGSRIALIDTAVDAGHPDLAGRLLDQRDFVSIGAGKPATTTAPDQRHGTEVAGVIAALANNGIGIVGIAPAARILSYRACWATPANPAARCNSFTLALALAEAIRAQARIIHLSLGGPADPLLQQLLVKALQGGAIVVAALPPEGRRDGFPLDVAGVIAIAGDDQRADGSLRAPSSNILALQPGGYYDYSSGSSLAAAEASAIIALLLQHRPRLAAADALALLQASSRRDGSINACRAIAALLERGDAACPPAAASAIGIEENQSQARATDRRGIRTHGHPANARSP